MWGIFRKHHYLTAEFNKASQVYLVFWENTLVGFASVISMPCGTLKYAFRQHRLVILPDFQGLGIGTKVNDFIAQLYVSQGNKYFIRTTHLRMNEHLSKDKRWKATSRNNKKRGDTLDACKEKMKIKMGDYRIAGSFEYLGEDYCNKEHKKIIIDNDETISKEELVNLKNKYYLTIVTGQPKIENDTEKLCKSLGIRTELLYTNATGKLKRKEQ